MYCLHCGDCCKRMSPLSAPEPCPKLVEVEGFCLCGDYERRPDQCVNHDFPSHVCPVGWTVLGICSTEDMRLRVDRGHAMIKRGVPYGKPV